MWYGCTEGTECYDSHKSSTTGNNQTYFYMAQGPKTQMEAKGDIAYSNADSNYEKIRKKSGYGGHCFNTDLVG